MRRHSFSPHAAGFTLIEVLLAAFLTALVMTVIASTFASTREATIRVQERAELEQMGRVALDVFVKEMQAAHLDPLQSDNTRRYVFLGLNGHRSDAHHDRLYFVTLAPRGTLTTGLSAGVSEIEWSLDIEPAEHSGFLMHREDPLPDDNHEEGGVAFDLAERATDLNFRFLNVENEWVDEWDSNANIPPLPKAVEMTLGFESIRGERVTISTVALVEMHARFR